MLCHFFCSTGKAPNLKLPVPFGKNPKVDQTFQQKTCLLWAIRTDCRRDYRRDSQIPPSVRSYPDMCKEIKKIQADCPLDNFSAFDGLQKARSWIFNNKKSFSFPGLFLLPDSGQKAARCFKRARSNIGTEKSKFFNAFFIKPINQKFPATKSNQK